MRLRSLCLPAIAVLVALALAACVAKPANQGDPVASILIRGRVIDAGGHGFAGQLSLIVLDMADAQAGQPIPLSYSHDFTAATDGTFELHVGIEPSLSDVAAKNGGYVNFQLMAFTADGRPMFPFSFPRQIARGTWVGEPPDVVISPSGYTEPDEPAATVPPPA